MTKRAHRRGAAGARFLLMLAGAGGCVCWAAKGNADDKLQFFDDQVLSFEQSGRVIKAPVQREKEKHQEEEGGRHTPGPLDQGTEVKATQPLPMTSSNVGGLKILHVRQLSVEEQDAMKGSLKCSDPMAAEIQPAGGIKLILMRALGVTAERLPKTVFWVFGTRHCGEL